MAGKIMNGTNERSGPKQRPLDGRIEKRLPVSAPVYLASLREPRARELTVTENVSPHGARVTTKRPWRPGEEALIVPRTGDFSLVGKVVYSEQKTEGRFCLGVELLDRSVNRREFIPGLGSKIEKR